MADDGYELLLAEARDLLGRISLYTRLVRDDRIIPDGDKLRLVIQGLLGEDGNEAREGVVLEDYRRAIQMSMDSLDDYSVRARRYLNEDIGALLAERAEGIRSQAAAWCDLAERFKEG